MKNFHAALREEMTDPEFKDEWYAFEPEFNRIRETLREQKLSTAGVTLEPIDATFKHFRRYNCVRAVK